MTVAFPTTKTGPNQTVDVRDLRVRALLRDLVGSTSRAKAKLFPGGDRLYRSVFKACCRDLRLSPLYVPHSLRHGGATRMYLLAIGESVDAILIRGRWAVTKSARRYIQSSKAVAIATTVPRHIQSLATALVKDVVASFAQAQRHKRKR
jgi:integrase